MPLRVVHVLSHVEIEDELEEKQAANALL